MLVLVTTVEQNQTKRNGLGIKVPQKKNHFKFVVYSIVAMNALEHRKIASPFCIVIQ